MVDKKKAATLDADVKETVAAVHVYEPHENKTMYKPGDAAYGHKKPCMLADGTYPETATDED